VKWVGWVGRVRAGWVEALGKPIELIGRALYNGASKRRIAAIDAIDKSLLLFMSSAGAREQFAFILTPARCCDAYLTILTTPFDLKSKKPGCLVYSEDEHLVST
jgi:hypothetical protein